MTFLGRWAISFAIFCAALLAGAPVSQSFADQSKPPIHCALEQALLEGTQVYSGYFWPENIVGPSDRDPDIFNAFHKVLTQTPIGRVWVRDVFACNARNLANASGIVNLGLAQSIVNEVCHQTAPSCSTPDTPEDSLKWMVDINSQLTQLGVPQKIYDELHVKSTDDCSIYAFTVSDSAHNITFIPVKGEKKPSAEQWDQVARHEFAILLDSKTSLKSLRPMLKVILPNQADTIAFSLTRARYAQNGFEALRAMRTERMIRESLRERPKKDDQFAEKLLQQADQSEAGCFSALRQVEGVLAKLSEGDFVHHLVSGTNNAPDSSSVQRSLSFEKQITGVQVTDEHGRKTSLCQWLTVPKYSLPDGSFRDGPDPKSGGGNFQDPGSGGGNFDDPGSGGGNSPKKTGAKP